MGPRCRKGTLTLLRSQASVKRSCAVWPTIELGRFSFSGEARTERRSAKPSLLADAYEAVFGASIAIAALSWCCQAGSSYPETVLRVTGKPPLDFKSSAAKSFCKGQKRARPRYKKSSAAKPTTTRL